MFQRMRKAPKNISESGLPFAILGVEVPSNYLWTLCKLIFGHFLRIFGGFFFGESLDIIAIFGLIVIIASGTITILITPKNIS